MTMEDLVSPSTLEQQMLRTSGTVPETQTEESEKAPMVAETESDEEVLVVFTPTVVPEPETRVLTEVEESRGRTFPSDGQHRYKRMVKKKEEMMWTRAMQVGENHEESK